MADIPKYEKEHLRNIAAIKRKIKQLFDTSTERITRKVTKIRFKGEVFDVNKFPALKKMIDEELKVLNSEVYATTINGITESWKLSNRKNDLMVANRVGEGAPDWLFDPNKDAMNAFIKRKEKGLNLSDRVWNGMQSHRVTLEADLGLGILEGKAAKAIASDIKQHLLEPDKLFRRIRNAEGKLVLSKAAKSYHPGQGVYRSSYKNALRVAATETNIAYRTADFERWKDTPFIIGMQVNTSNNHPRPDICDQLKGKYPKDFKFVGWHPWCICYSIPIMVSDAEYSKMEDAILDGKRVAAPKNSLIKSPPAAFTEHIRANSKELAKSTSKPYYVRDNRKYLP